MITPRAVHHNTHFENLNAGEKQKKLNKLGSGLTREKGFIRELVAKNGFEVSAEKKGLFAN